MFIVPDSMLRQDYERCAFLGSSYRLFDFANDISSPHQAVSFSCYTSRRCAALFLDNIDADSLALRV